MLSLLGQKIQMSLGPCAIFDLWHHIWLLTSGLLSILEKINLEFKKKAL